MANEMTIIPTADINSQFILDIKAIVQQSRQQAYLSVNAIMISTYWQIGRRIVEEEQSGSQRADYGKRIITTLAQELTHEFGNGFSERYLRAFRQFYLLVPDFDIWKSRFPNLTWTHIFRTLRVGDETAIRWYLEEAATQMWSVRTLNRNISTQYYERHFKAPLPATTRDEQYQPSELIKSPVVAEFLGLPLDTHLTETQLETAIINHLQRFIMEMGRGFAFMNRQKLVRTAADDYYIDLVFYNVLLKCYVLIDLKIGKITHEDAGQMKMYVNMYDKEIKTPDDHPTLGIILCSETDEDIARYWLNDEQNIYMSKYLLYLPSKQDLQKEITRQKALFELQEKKQ